MHGFAAGVGNVIPSPTVIGARPTEVVIVPTLQSAPAEQVVRRHYALGASQLKIFDWLDGIEVTVVAIVAALLLVLGPLFISYRFALAHRHEAALLTGALWICCIAAWVRDFRRQPLSWVSGGVLALWLVTTLVLGLIVT